MTLSLRFTDDAEIKIQGDASLVLSENDLQYTVNQAENEFLETHSKYDFKYGYRTYLSHAYEMVRQMQLAQQADLRLVVEKRIDISEIEKWRKKECLFTHVNSRYFDVNFKAYDSYAEKVRHEFSKEFNPPTHGYSLDLEEKDFILLTDINFKEWLALPIIGEDEIIQKAVYSDSPDWGLQEDESGITCISLYYQEEKVEWKPISEIESHELVGRNFIAGNYKVCLGNPIVNARILVKVIK